MSTKDQKPGISAEDVLEQIDYKRIERDVI